MPVAFSRFLAVLPLHNVHMNARLSGPPAFILNGLLTQQNACASTIPRVHLRGSYPCFCPQKPIAGSFIGDDGRSRTDNSA